MSGKRVDYKCEQCGESQSISEAIRSREVEGEIGVNEVGLVCTQCGHWQHAYFLDWTLRRDQERLKRLAVEARLKLRPEQERKHRKALRAYQRRFDRVNRRLRKKLGIEAPAYQRGEEGLSGG